VIKVQEIKVQAVEYVDFEDGTTHTARVSFINPKGAPIDYEGLFYLADPGDLTTPVNVPEPKTFSVAAGASKNVDFSVQMPLIAVAQMNLVACVQVKVGGVPITTFFGGKIVRLTFTPAIDWGDITWI